MEQTKRGFEMNIPINKNRSRIADREGLERLGISMSALRNDLEVSLCR
jgi:hypothetical protein